ncbi:MAG: hypothetical protein E7543_01730 [Ruminococcaceae bacterium]|nr:hypothetical protein [Oscillospiraceae bacterium]MBQ9914306.1 hypothetical protein [Clostridia bacterium]
MNNEMKKLLSGFLFSGVLICCLGLLAVGSITASQKSAKNTFDRAYAVMSVKSTGKGLEINMGEDKYSFDVSAADKIKEYEDYILLSPLAGIYYFFLSAQNMNTELRTQNTESSEAQGG